jgi:hypothetical protein
MVSQGHNLSQIFIELGVVIVGLALLARFANRFTFSAIPLYLLAGLAFGNGGLVPLNVSQDFTHIGAEIGGLFLILVVSRDLPAAEDWDADAAHDHGAAVFPGECDAVESLDERWPRTVQPFSPDREWAILLRLKPLGTKQKPMGRP